MFTWFLTILLFHTFFAQSIPSSWDMIIFYVSQDQSLVIFIENAIFLPWPSLFTFKWTKIFNLIQFGFLPFDFVFGSLDFKWSFYSLISLLSECFLTHFIVEPCISFLIVEISCILNYFPEFWKFIFCKKIKELSLTLYLNRYLL